MSDEFRSDLTDKRPVSITYFKTLKNSTGEIINFLSQDTFMSWCLHPVTEINKHNLPGFSPATFVKNHRSLQSVTSVSCVILDVDDGYQDPYDSVKNLAPFTVFFHSTFSDNKDGKRRYRLYIPLTRDVNPEEHSVLVDVLSKTHDCGEKKVDPKCKDASRFWFVSSIGEIGSEIDKGGRRRRILNPDNILFYHIDKNVGVRHVDIPQSANRDVVRVLSDNALARARRYLARVDPAVSGQGGHLRTFTTALKLIGHFGLSEEETYWLMKLDYNAFCEPPWSDYELKHKVKDAYNSYKKGSR